MAMFNSKLLFYQMVNYDSSQKAMISLNLTMTPINSCGSNNVIGTTHLPGNGLYHPNYDDFFGWFMIELYPHKKNYPDQRRSLKITIFDEKTFFVCLPEATPSIMMIGYQSTQLDMSCSTSSY